MYVLILKMYACVRQCVKALLYSSQPKMECVAVNAANEAGDTALHLAAKWGYSMYF